MGVTIFVDPLFAIVFGIIAANIVNAAQLESLELDSVISDPAPQSSARLEDRLPDILDAVRAEMVHLEGGGNMRRCAAGAAAQAPLGLSAQCTTAFMPRALRRQGSGGTTPFGASGVNTKAAPGGRGSQSCSRRDRGIDAGGPGSSEPPRRVSGRRRGRSRRQSCAARCRRRRQSCLHQRGQSYTPQCEARCTAQPCDTRLTTITAICGRYGDTRSSSTRSSSLTSMVISAPIWLRCKLARCPHPLVEHLEECREYP